MIEIKSRVQKVIALWTKPVPGNLQRIVEICGEIEAEAASGKLTTAIDDTLLRRAARLAACAEERCAECLLIQIQTGNYSKQGAPECLSHMATSGWEG